MIVMTCECDEDQGCPVGSVADCGVERCQLDRLPGRSFCRVHILPTGEWASHPDWPGCYELQEDDER